MIGTLGHLHGAAAATSNSANNDIVCLIIESFLHSGNSPRSWDKARDKNICSCGADIELKGQSIKRKKGMCLGKKYKDGKLKLYVGHPGKAPKRCRLHCKLV